MTSGWADEATTCQALSKKKNLDHLLGPKMVVKMVKVMQHIGMWSIGFCLPTETLISPSICSVFRSHPNLCWATLQYCKVNWWLLGKSHFLLVKSLQKIGISPQKPTAFPGQETLHEVQRWRSSRRARVGRQQKWNQIGRLLKLFMKFTAIEPNIFWGCNGNVDIDNACVCTYVYIITVCTYSNGVQPNNKWELPRRNGANKQWFDVTWCHPQTLATPSHI